MTDIWAITVGSIVEKAVLLALGDNANDAGECYPSLSSIARKSEASLATVKRALISLESKGHISRERRPNQSTVYRIHLAHSEPRLTQTLGSHRAVTRLTQSLPPGSQRAGGRLTVSPITIIEPSIEPSLNRQVARAARKASQPKCEEPPPSNLNVEAWHRWAQYRQEIRRPIKPASLAAAQRKLAGFGLDQGAVVEQSIANGWQGLFELKGVPQGTEPVRRWRPTDDEEFDHAGR